MIPLGALGASFGAAWESEETKTRAKRNDKSVFGRAKIEGSVRVGIVILKINFGRDYSTFALFWH